MEANVKFKDASITIHVNGQKINQSSLTQEDYDYLVSWNPSYADYFVSIEEKIQPKAKLKTDGKAPEGTVNN